MHEFLFGRDLTDNDLYDLKFEQKDIDIDIDAQIDFIITFDIPPDKLDNYLNNNNFNYHSDNIEYYLSKNFSNLPEYVFCKFRDSYKYVAIFWHD